MPKVILDKREVELWKTGKTNAPDLNNAHCREIPNGWTYEQWRKEVSDALYTLAGHMGGYGITLEDEDGNNLSPSEDEDYTYQPPDVSYRKVYGSEMIRISDLKDN